VAAIASAMLLTACASTASAPGPEVRQVLAPTGKLRVGLYPGSPTSMVRDPASGAPRGVAYDVGEHLAARLGVAFEPVVFASNAQLLDAAKAGRVDVIFTNATAARARFLDFTPTVLEVEKGYLVAPRSAISTPADIDRPGVRVGVSQGSTSQTELAGELHKATIVPAASLKDAVGMLSSGKLDAFATNKAILFEMADQLAGSRVLEGRWGLEAFAFGIPKGREAALPYLRKFVEEARSEGVVARAVERAGLRGTVGTPSK
jgi:polar amino acid transport system substrate-binding protein